MECWSENEFGIRNAEFGILEHGGRSLGVLEYIFFYYLIIYKIRVTGTSLPSPGGRD